MFSLCLSRIDRSPILVEPSTSLPALSPYNTPASTPSSVVYQVIGQAKKREHRHSGIQRHQASLPPLALARALRCMSISGKPTDSEFRAFLDLTSSATKDPELDLFEYRSMSVPRADVCVFACVSWGLASPMQSCGEPCDGGSLATPHVSR